MNVLLNAFIEGLFVGAIIASVTVIIYLLYLKVKEREEAQKIDH